MAAFEKVTEMSYGKVYLKQFTIKRRVFGLSWGLPFPAEKPEGTPDTIGSLFKDSTDSYDGGIDCKRSRGIFHLVDKARGVSEGVLRSGKRVLHFWCPHQGRYAFATCEGGVHWDEYFRHMWNETMIEMYHPQELLEAFDSRRVRKISDGANFLRKRYNAFGIDVVAEEIDGRDAENTLGAFDDEAVVF